MGICVGESDSEMRVIGNTGPGGAVQPSDLLQVLAVVVLLQREVQGDGGDRRDDHFGDHVAGVVGDGPQRGSPAQLVRPQGLPDDPAGHEVAGQTQQRGEHTADGDGHGAVLDALVKEMRFVADRMKGRRLDTVYFGGGTPTTLEPEQLDRLLNELEADFDMSTVKELTVEAGRPDSVTVQKLEVLKKHGVDRISINPQTMNDKTLEIIGRRHSATQVEEAFKLARSVGFDNINMDIILGLPGEGINELRYTLDKIKELKPESLTVHSLAIKRAAALNIWREKYEDLKFENSDETVSLAQKYAGDIGCMPYYMYRQKNMAGNLENVGYSVPGKECIYNILIMEEKQTIIAMGAGASTKAVFDADQPSPRIERVENVKDLTSYISRIDEMIERKRIFFDNNML